MNRRDFIAGSACGVAALLFDPAQLIASAQPRGVMVDPAIVLPGPGGIGQLVLEPTKHRLAFWQRGVRQWVFDASGTERFELNGPRAIVCNDKGRTFIANTGNDCVTVLSSGGQRVAELGGWGDDLGRFRSPSGLAIGPDGLLYVSDTLNHRIQVLDPETGRALRSFGKLRLDGSGLNGPGALVFDHRGVLHVAERGSERITRFSASGRRLGTYGEGELAMPRSMALDADGTVYVADRQGVATFRSSDGTLTRRFVPRAEGRPLVPHSVALRGDGTLQVTGSFASA